MDRSFRGRFRSLSLLLTAKLTPNKCFWFHGMYIVDDVCLPSGWEITLWRAMDDGPWDS